MTLHHGDCLEVMAGMEPESVDAIVTDPPYGLGEPRSGSDEVSGRCFSPRSSEAKARRSVGFMGKAWDGTGVAFRRETWEAAYRVAKPSAYLLAFGGTRTVHRLTSAIEDAGWIIRDMLVWAYASGFPKSKASLKPAWEPIVMARKPGPLRELAIDLCRIGTTKDVPASVGTGRNRDGWAMQTPSDTNSGFDPTIGRWPANVLLTAPIFDGGWDGVVGGGETASGGRHWDAGDTTKTNLRGEAFRAGGIDCVADSGTYSRFFLVPKADRTDREPVLGGQAYRANVHPTVKPTELMRHLVRLVTPTGGTVLDPFLGSGSTAIAAEMEGFDWIGIEKEAEYVAIAEARLNGTQRGLGLPA